MAEVQKTTQSGEMSQRFIEFVMMHAQNAALFLGQIPNPKTGQGEVNLELAKMFIDQLAMIQEKTRGNLTNDEATVLKNTLSNSQMNNGEERKRPRERRQSRLLRNPSRNNPPPPTPRRTSRQHRRLSPVAKASRRKNSRRATARELNAPVVRRTEL